MRKGPRVTSDRYIVPPASSRCPGTHPELFPKLFVFPEAISHRELAPFPPSPPAEGPTNPLALHSHQGQNWGHHLRTWSLGTARSWKFLLSSLEPNPRALQGAEGSARSSQCIPGHSSPFLDSSQSRPFPSHPHFGMGGKGPPRANRQENLLGYLGSKKEN